MGVNAHVLPGDLVVTTCRSQLSFTAPEQYYHSLGSRFKGSGTVEGNVPCIVLAIEKAGSNGGGHVFLVLSTTGKVGWLWNHDVYPFATQREVPGA